MPHVNPDEVFRKAQDGIRNRLFKEAQQSDELLRSLGAKIANEFGCAIAYGPIKGLDRASQKVNAPTEKEGYGGDWYQLKDVVRLTIVAPRLPQVKQVGDRVRATCVLGSGMKILKDVETFPSIDPCGYSDLKFVIRLPNERPAEIQVNIPTMIYGKEDEKVSKVVLGAPTFNRLKCMFGVDGGYGHKLYEIYRSAPATNKGKFAAGVSFDYYGYLRGGFHNQTLVQQLKKDLAAVFSMGPPPLRSRSNAISGPSMGPPPLRRR